MKSKNKLSIWDIIAWIVLGLILIWLILKVFGVINTPVLIEYAPYFGAVYLIGWQIHKLESVASDVKDLKRLKNATIKEITNLKINCVKKHTK
jgi:hypothetical protein